MSGELAPGTTGQLFHLGAGDGTSEATGVLTTLPETRAYVTTLACQDRSVAGRRPPAKYPGDKWEEVRLESAAFEDRYRLLVLAGQDAGWTHELFSPALIAWLSDRAPAGLSFELNEGHLCVFVPGILQSTDDLAALCDFAAGLADRIRTEALEEGADPDIVRAAEITKKMNAAIDEVEWPDPPASVAEAIAAYRKVAAGKPATIAVTIVGTVVVAAIGAGLGWMFAEGAGLLAGAALGAILGFGIVRLGAIGSYKFEGALSAEWVGINAFNREYARSRGLERQKKFAFHHENRDLPVPGFAESVQAGPVPGTGLSGLFLMIADSPELRASGRKTMGADPQGRPLSYDALLVELPRPPTAEEVGKPDLPADYRMEPYGERKVVVWRPIPGNMARTAKSCDEFRATAGRLIAAIES